MSPRKGADFAEFERLRRRIIVALVALFAVIATGVVGYTIIGRGTHTFIDAVYMTVITLTTVGYGEIIDMSNHPGGRLFTIALLLSGAGIVAYTVPMLSALVIEGQLHHLFSRRRMLRKIEAMRDHFIVCGDNSAAVYVAEELARTQRDVVLVVPHEEALQSVTLRLHDLPSMVGDPTDDDVLIAAGITICRGVVASMEGDKDNILVVLGARRLAPTARIIAATELLQSEGKLRVAGADGIVSPSKIGGMRMASELVRPTVVRFLDEMLRDKSADLRIEEVAVPADLPAGRQVSSLWGPEVAGVVLLAIRKGGNGGFEFRPPSTTPLHPGMVLVVMSDGTGRDRLESKMQQWRGDG